MHAKSKLYCLLAPVEKKKRIGARSRAARLTLWHKDNYRHNMAQTWGLTDNCCRYWSYIHKVINNDILWWFVSNIDPVHRETNHWAKHQGFWWVWYPLIDTLDRLTASKATFQGSRQLFVTIDTKMSKSLVMHCSFHYSYSYEFDPVPNIENIYMLSFFLSGGGTCY